MTDQNNKQEIPKYKSEEMQKMYMESLKLNAEILGANTLKSEYGKVGEDVSGFLINGEGAAEMRQQLFAQKKQEAGELGIAFEPYIGNYEVVKSAQENSQGLMTKLTLGNLEKLVKDTSSGIPVSVEEKFKQYSYEDFVDEYKKVQEDLKKGDSKPKMSREAEAVMQYHKLLSEAVVDAFALKGLNDAKAKHYEMQSKELSAMYAKKEESEDKE